MSEAGSSGLANALLAATAEFTSLNEDLMANWLINRSTEETKTNLIDCLRNEVHRKQDAYRAKSRATVVELEAIDSMEQQWSQSSLLQSRGFDASSRFARLTSEIVSSFKQSNWKEAKEWVQFQKSFDLDLYSLSLFNDLAIFGCWRKVCFYDTSKDFFRSCRLEDIPTCLEPVDDQHIVVGTGSGKIVLIDGIHNSVKSGGQIHSNKVNRLSVLNKTMVASASNDGTWCLTDIQTQQYIRRNGLPVAGVQCLYNSNNLTTWDATMGSVKVWDIRMAQSIVDIVHPGVHSSVIISDNPTQLVAASAQSLCIYHSSNMLSCQNISSTRLKTNRAITQLVACTASSEVLVLKIDMTHLTFPRSSIILGDGTIPVEAVPNEDGSTIVARSGEKLVVFK